MEEKILFQYVMSYKAYRRAMISCRAAVAAVAAGALAALCVVSVPLGIVLAVAALFVGALAVLVSLHREYTYTVYGARIVFKKGGDDRRASVPTERVTAVSYKSAFYEKDLGTGTVTVTVRTDKGGKKRYRMKHILDAAPCVDYLKKTAARNNGATADGE